MLSGVAGMRLGLALIHPGRLSRRHALYAASQRMFPVIVGAALLTVLAAFFEAFWSANGAIPVAVKYFGRRRMLAFRDRLFQPDVGRAGR